MMSVTSPALAVARPCALRGVVERRQIVLGHVRQHEILLVRHADLVMPVALREIGDGFHLFGRGIARDAADRLQRDRHDGIARHLVARDIGFEKGGETRVLRFPSARARPMTARAARDRAARNRRGCGRFPRPEVPSPRGAARRIPPRPPRGTPPGPFSCTRILTRALNLLSRRPSRL